MMENRIFNKKGFTLLELLIAVAIFGVLSTMTFSIINYVPKLAKSESGRFEERTDVRRALTEITGTIQNAKGVTFPSLEFTMPNDDIVVYRYVDGNVNKYVNGVPQRLMESIKEFSITEVNTHLFHIHIKTAEDNRVYDFRVERRSGGGTKSDAVISTISPASAVFDKNPSLQQDIDITMSLNGNELNGLTNDLDNLKQGTDYTISGNVLTLKKEYLLTQNGTINIIFNVTNGVDPVLTVEIRDTSSYLKIEGNSLEDDLIRMKYPGNLGIDPDDNMWIIRLTNGTASSDISINDLIITGLPAGINATASKGSGNRIVVTLAGTASAPVSVPKAISIVVKGSGVTNTSALDSDPIEVLLLPGAHFGSPEHNLLFTNELEIVSNADITGDIVIGRNSSTTTINSNTDIYGNVYVASSLTVNSNFNVGTDSKKKNLFVKGSVKNQSNTKIFGNLFYRDTLTNTSHLKVTGVTQQSAVEIPDISIPKPRSEQWYRENGYAIIENSSTYVELVDNGKYYFKNDYSFNYVTKDADNITVVGLKDITINSSFSGSGILFTPYGKITVNGNFDFTGMCVSQSTRLANNTDLIFKRYAEVPFD